MSVYEFFRNWIILTNYHVLGLVLMSRSSLDNLSGLDFKINDKSKKKVVPGPTVKFIFRCHELNMDAAKCWNGQHYGRKWGNDRQYANVFAWYIHFVDLTVWLIFLCLSDTPQARMNQQSVCSECVVSHDRCDPELYLLYM